MTRFAPYPLSLRQLQYLVAVAQYRSFRRAAAACGVSQPSLSAQVAQAEESLGAQVFERSTRQVKLSSAGRAIVERARGVLLEYEALLDTARREADPFSGLLRLGIIPTVGPYLLPLISPPLRERYPALTLLWFEEKTSVLIKRLQEGELEAAVLAAGADVQHLPQVVLGDDPFVFAAASAHPLAASTKRLRSSALEGEKVLLLDDGHCFRDQALHYCARAGAEEAGFRATSLATLVQMVAAGAGVTLLPELALPVENRQASLRVRHFAEQAPMRTLVLVWRTRSAAEITLRALGETMAKLYRKTRTAKGGVRTP